MMDFNKDLFVNDLLKWYELNKRPLPWRKNHDPYRIWISEIMLQQTQVNTVIPYFERFIETFPTVEALAMASSESVLKVWEGLGYYSRARNLHETAKIIVTKFNGEFPKSYDELLKLKGVGTYTAGAISSIAFNQAHPAVDGNIMRVMSRVMKIYDDLANPKTKTKFEIMMKDVIPVDHPREFNQALMELGALICRPKGQKCYQCPVRNHCQAYQEGVEEYYPVKTPKAAQRKITYHTALVNINGRYLMRKRPDVGLLANMWEFIQYECKNVDELSEYLTDNYQIELFNINKAEVVEHVFSHLIWEMHVYRIEAHTINYLPKNAELFTIAELDTIPISTAHRKLLVFLDQNESK